MKGVMVKLKPQIHKLWHQHNLQPFEDSEWDEAWNADEKPRYFKCWMWNGGTCYHLYKPSIARLIVKRRGFKFAYNIEDHYVIYPTFYPIYNYVNQLEGLR